MNAKTEVSLWLVVTCICLTTYEVGTEPNELPLGQQLYIFSIPENYKSGVIATLYMSSEHTATYRVTAPKIGLHRRGTIEGSTSFSLDARLEMKGTGVSKSSVTIQSNASLDVHLLIDWIGYSSSDTILFKPLEPSSKDFFVMTFSETLMENQFTVNVPFDNTEVHILLKCPKCVVEFEDRNYTGDQTIGVTLNSFDAIKIQSKGDLTGTYIESSKPVSVISGNKCMVIRGACDFVADQILPVYELGMNYIASKLENDGSAVVKILASGDGTSLRINGRNAQRLLNQGDFYEVRLTQSTVMSIQANRPVSVVLFYDLMDQGDPADPFMVNLLPMHQCDFSYGFEVPSGYRNYFLVIYAESSKIDGIRLDGKRVHFTTQKTTTLDSTRQSIVAGKLTIDTGKHSLRHIEAGTRFCAMLYGLARYASFGTFLGVLYGPLCYPACAHGGICVAENTCHCQLGYYGQYCQLGDGIPNNLRPVLFAPINGTDDNFLDPLSWYSDSPLSSMNKVCFVKVLVKNATKDTIVKAVSSTTDGVEYGNFTVGPIVGTIGISGLTRFACLEVKCPFLTLDGYQKDTVVNISLSGTNANQCHIGHVNPYHTNFTILSDNGRADMATVVLEVGNNYGPNFGVYIAIDDRQKAKFLAEHKCYSGRENDLTTYNPENGILAEFDC